MIDDELEVLDTHHCWDLVRAHVIGRFAVNRPGRSPLVLPVNYTVEPNLDIVIRTGPGSKVDLATQDPVALEVDHIDPTHHAGWSVVIEGLARVFYVSDGTEPTDTWAPGSKPYAIRIHPLEISGRQLRLHTPETDERGYR